MVDPSTLVLVARIGAPHGVKGLVKLDSFTETPNNVFNYQGLQVKKHNSCKDIKLDLVATAKERFIAKIDGITTREDAATLANCEVFVSRSAFQSLTSDEFYWQDVLGFNVINQQGVTLGKLVDIMNTLSNDVMIVEGVADKRHLIPYIYNKFVLEINEAKQTIVVDWDPEF